MVDLPDMPSAMAGRDGSTEMADFEMPEMPGQTVGDGGVLVLHRVQLREESISSG